MRRKRLQHQADTLCHTFCGDSLIYDYQTISTLGSGRLSIDVLAEQNLFEGAPIPPLNISGILARWLLNDLTDNNIPAEKLCSVTLEADLKFGSVSTPASITIMRSGLLICG